MVISTPPDLNAVTDARIAAEHSGDDDQLLLMRDLELAHQSLPPCIDGARRVRLLATDAISTTWEGWNLDGGERVFLRCLRPRWRTDPVMSRRLSLDAQGDVSWHADGDWPHLRAITRGGLLLDRFPIEDVSSTEQLARTLGFSLQALGRLHAQGRVHPGPLAAFMVERDRSIELVCMGAFSLLATPQDNIRSLAEIICALDPAETTPVTQLAEEWITAPPPTASDAVQILQKCLSGVLLSERHRLCVAGRSTARMDRAARLSRAIRSLSQHADPPIGKFCLRSGQDGVIVIAESDGEIVRGGATADLSEGRFLPIIYSKAQGLDAQSARFLMRSWAMRGDGDPDAQASHNETLGSRTSDAERLVRWLSAMARLRSATLILRARQGAV